MSRVVAFSAWAALTLLVLHAAPADACSCEGRELTPGLAAAGNVVFRGKVARVENERFPRRLVVSFDEVVTLLGETTPLTIETNAAVESCGYEFEVGREYVVYARHVTVSDSASSRQTLWTVACSRTRRIEAAAEDVAYMDRRLQLVRRRRAAHCGSVGLEWPAAAIALAFFCRRRSGARSSAMGPRAPAPLQNLERGHEPLVAMREPLPARGRPSPCL